MQCLKITTRPKVSDDGPTCDHLSVEGVLSVTGDESAFGKGVRLASCNMCRWQHGCIMLGATNPLDYVALQLLTTCIVQHEMSVTSKEAPACCSDQINGHTRCRSTAGSLQARYAPAYAAVAAALLPATSLTL